MKYPILLVHGLGVKNTKVFKSFGNIDKVLREEGYTVYTSSQDGFGTVENNAEQLKQEILDILEKENKEKINLIAHSKGGLDAKYLIENLGIEDKIASLTTICTPFKGSIIANKVLTLPKFVVKATAKVINFLFKKMKDQNPDAIKATEQLKTIDGVEIETLKISTNIYCQSFSTTLLKSRDDLILSVPFIYFKYNNIENNDGLVEEDSAKFENYRGKCIEDSISHANIIDFMTSKKKKEKVYTFYKELCKDLENKGF